MAADVDAEPGVSVFCGDASASQAPSTSSSSSQPKSISSTDLLLIPLVVDELEAIAFHRIHVSDVVAACGSEWAARDLFSRGCSVTECSATLHTRCSITAFVIDFTFTVLCDPSCNVGRRCNERTISTEDDAPFGKPASRSCRSKGALTGRSVKKSRMTRPLP